MILQAPTQPHFEILIPPLTIFYGNAPAMMYSVNIPLRNVIITYNLPNSQLENLKLHPLEEVISQNPVFQIYHRFSDSIECSFGV